MSLSEQWKAFCRSQLSFSNQVQIRQNVNDRLHSAFVCTLLAILINTFSLFLHTYSFFHILAWWSLFSICAPTMVKKWYLFPFRGHLSIGNARLSTTNVYLGVLHKHLIIFFILYRNFIVRCERWIHCIVVQAEIRPKSNGYHLSCHDICQTPAPTWLLQSHKGIATRADVFYGYSLVPNHSISF